MGQIISQATPHLVEIASIVLASAIAWAAAAARRKWGIDVTARHREALHSAVMTGALLAAGGNLTPQAALAIVLDHVRASVPEALAALTPSTKTLENLARAKLAEVQRRGRAK
ncbi:MAG: hypothetical protein Q4G25_12745 [Paracoccus sp. (in: a-proteobacteria)]|nr:hypothetical protein [Paracoccus sp. (in: a-proteobacteria)]